MASNKKSRNRLVSNEPLRRAYLNSGLSSWDMARALGYERLRSGGKRVPDASTVLRGLGLRPDGPNVKSVAGGARRYPPKLRTHMREATALRYAKALNLDPHEIGL